MTPTEIIESITQFHWQILAIEGTVLLLAIVTFYDIFKKIKDIFGFKFAGELKEEAEEDAMKDIEARISELERLRAADREASDEHDKEITSAVNEIKDLLKEHIEDGKATNVATIKPMLYNIYTKSSKAGYISRDELEIFVSLYSIYRASGGNGIVEEKIYPAVTSLPLQEELEN